MGVESKDRYRPGPAFQLNGSICLKVNSMTTEADGQKPPKNTVEEDQEGSSQTKYVVALEIFFFLVVVFFILR